MTGPSGLVKTLYETYPGIKAFGCCREVFGTRKLLAEVVRERLYAKMLNATKAHLPGWRL